MKVKYTLEKYLYIALTSLIIIFLMRFLEAGTMLFTFGNEKGMILSELAGIGLDVIDSLVILLLLFPLYFLISRCSERLADMLFMTVITLLTVAHFLLLQYFFSQHKPLGSLLFGYSLDEILLTVKTANISIFSLTIAVIVIIALPLVTYYLAKKKLPYRVVRIIIWALLPISIPVTIVACLTYNDFTSNKSYVFYKAAIDYKTEEKIYCHEITREVYFDYRNMFRERNNFSEEYPLLHYFETEDSLGYYFNDFEKKPNVVILFVEGLNDDFVHDYHGANLMPNLRKMMENSLYWRRCFTLGERSFAVVPSLLGGLPYGEIGFTLLDQLPTHLTLVSVLGANGYQTDFFYGQGSWFHKKNIFFKKNNISLIFDNACYSDKYPKILVGKDNYFWGYDDKCLFQQSLEVIDTLSDKPRLDMYFTGSTHSPFIISETEKYDKRMKEIRDGLETRTDRKFFKHFNDYARTILFLDDAIGDFIENYSKRDDFKNTIFVITGDHPMTEIPPVNSLKRYHVPFIIYSPNLKTSATFSNTVSHLDFYETMIAFMEKYGVERPEYSASFGRNMFKESNNIAFMDEPRNMVDLYYGGYYVSEDNLYRVDDDFNIYKFRSMEIYDLSKPAELYSMKRRLQEIKEISEYTSLENKIMPIDVYCKALKDTLLREFKNKNDIVFSGKYHNLVPEIDVTEFDTLVLDFSLDYHGVDDACQLVYRISDENGNNISTEYFGIGKDGRKYAFHKQIPLKNKGGKIVFNAFLFNPEQQECTISRLDGILLGNIK